MCALSKEVPETEYRECARTQSLRGRRAHTSPRLTPMVKAVSTCASSLRAPSRLHLSAGDGPVLRRAPGTILATPLEELAGPMKFSPVGEAPQSTSYTVSVLLTPAGTIDALLLRYDFRILAPPPSASSPQVNRA
jgi:hypothetical protein